MLPVYFRSDIKQVVVHHPNVIIRRWLYAQNAAAASGHNARGADRFRIFVQQASIWRNANS